MNSLMEVDGVVAVCSPLGTQRGIKALTRNDDPLGPDAKAVMLDNSSPSALPVHCLISSLAVNPSSLAHFHTLSTRISASRSLHLNLLRPSPSQSDSRDTWPNKRIS